MDKFGIVFILWRFLNRQVVHRATKSLEFKKSYVPTTLRPNSISYFSSFCLNKDTLETLYRDKLFSYCYHKGLL